LLGHEHQDSLALASLNQESTTADVQNEELVSNIFPVLQLPFYVNVAIAKIKKRSDVWEMLGEGVDLPPFAVDENENKIYSFADLKNPQHRFGDLCLELSTKRLLTGEMLSGNRSTIVIELLNRSMTRHMQKIGMTYDWKNTKKTFFQLEKAEDQIRDARWKVGKIEYTRFLVRKSLAKNPYYVHRSCKATFTLIDAWPYLKIQPGWHFTQDGIRTPVSPHRMSSLSSRWMNKQRNHSVLDDLRFWIYILSRGSSQLDLSVGSNVNVIVSTVPIFVNIDRGIEGDYRKRFWHEKPGIDYLQKTIEKLQPLENVEKQTSDEAGGSII